MVNPMLLLQVIHKSSRGTVLTLGGNLAFHDGLQPRGQFLAELDAPLVEGVDVPDRRLDEDPVLIERDEPAEREGIELAVGDGERRPVAGKDPVRRQTFRLGSLSCPGPEAGPRLP